jgi:site-specific recombinase XerD
MPAATRANAGHDTRRIQDWLGHRSIQHTTRYTQFERGAVRGLLGVEVLAARRGYLKPSCRV